MQRGWPSVSADVAFEEKGWELAPGDLLVAYTDGLVEAESGQGTPFGMERLVVYIKRDRHKPAAEILQGLLQAAWERIGGEDPQEAQRTILPWWFSRPHFSRARTWKIIPHVGKNERHVLPILRSPSPTIEP